MRKKVLMKGRYGLKHYLVVDEEDPNLYKLQTDKKTSYVSTIGDNFDDLVAVDPEGGPYISKGSKLLNKIISSIYQDEDGTIFIRLE
ncbi:MAG TPA: hypothetical protein PK626_00060 [Bacteroidales bacterium]|nr:hypothetical protein [Bacteroidales bacterium]